MLVFISENRIYHREEIWEMIYALLGIIIILLLVIIMNQRKKPTNGEKSGVTFLDSVLKESYPNRTYKEIIEVVFNNAEDLLETLPTYQGDHIEILAFLSGIGNITVECVGGNLQEYKTQIKEYVESVILEEDDAIYNRRIRFYDKIAHGKKVYGRWAYGNIPPAFLENSILRCAVAFGDCITNPDMIYDYEKAPVALYGFTEMAEFQKRFVGDFFRLVHTYCVMLAGKEFNPPILTDYEGKETNNGE